MYIGIHKYPCIAEKSGLFDPLRQAQKEKFPVSVTGFPENFAQFIPAIIY
jgi:hypothetical protein